MALSNSILESVKEAESSLRNALAFASRQEHPYVGKTIADMIFQLHMLQFVDRVIERMEDQASEGSFGEEP